MNFLRKAMALTLILGMVLFSSVPPSYARTISASDTGHLGNQNWSIDVDGDLLPNTDSSLDIGESGSEVDNLYLDSLWLGGVELTEASAISSPMTDETGYVRTQDGGTKFKLYDAGYLHLGDNSTDNDYYILFDGSDDDWAVGIDTTTDDYTISLGGAFATDNRLAITDDANHTIITIGDGTAAYDKYFVFDGAAAADYYVGIDDTGGDSEDVFVVGVGSAVGTTVAFSVDTSAVLAVTVGIDAIGAADMDYGSADVTDHTFTTDSTGDAEIVLPADSIGDAEIDWSGLTTSHGLIIGGTTPTLTVGDGGAEDNWVFFNNSTSTDDWSVGVDDTRDRFEIANGADLDQTVAISIDSSENVYIDTGDFTVSDGDVTITIDEASKPVITVENTNADATAGNLKFAKNSASPADDDDLGRISFYSDDSGGAASEFAYILAEAQDITATAEAGSIEISMEIADTDTSFVMFQAAAAASTGSIDFNMDSADIDFLVDGADQTDLFKVDAGSNDIMLTRDLAAANTDAALVQIFNTNVADDQSALTIIQDATAATAALPAVSIQTTGNTDQSSLFINHDSATGATGQAAVVIDSQDVDTAALYIMSPVDATGTTQNIDDAALTVVVEGVGGGAYISRNVATTTEPLMTLNETHADGTDMTLHITTGQDATADTSVVFMETTSTANDQALLELKQLGTYALLLTDGGVTLSVEDLTCSSADPGVASATPTTVLTTVVTDATGSAADEVDLPDGVKGDIKIFVLKTDGETTGLEIKPTNMSGGSKITFVDVGDGCIMVFDGTNWFVVANNGGTIS